MIYLLLLLVDKNAYSVDLVAGNGRHRYELLVARCVDRLVVSSLLDSKRYTRLVI